ncbi:uncharacterized protein LOC129901392 [Solanum dulcamara]|uniref:uncharacterized protein LOC129901392 n=1 Tax=Solanum dulcamara TaxID=45834 RepID=UPI0024854558|nr:uncharacterized protein LOC129901392 [Solanum dulcamara]
MEASKKLVAVFLVCIIVISSSVQISMADGESNTEKFKTAFNTAAVEYTACYNLCQKECSDAGFGYTHCEMKCDEDCTAKLLKEKIQNMKN